MIVVTAYGTHYHTLKADKCNSEESVCRWWQVAAISCKLRNLYCKPNCGIISCKYVSYVLHNRVKMPLTAFEARIKQVLYYEQSLLINKYLPNIGIINEDDL